MRLRYLGSIPTTFVALGLEVQSGDEFDVDDSAVPGYLARADVEAADPPKAPRRKAKADVPDPAVALDVSEGVADAVLDDH